MNIDLLMWMLGGIAFGIFQIGLAMLLARWVLRK